ncbi:MAG: DUF1428 domain-containing protein [Pseudomonadales bacterium]
MTSYIDGFVHPIPRNKLEEYQRLVNAVVKIWKEHGALEYWECVGDDLHLQGTRSFAELVTPRDDEVVLFGWVLFDSRETRDLANKAVASDPRMEKLMATTDTGFDGARMVYGGFQVFAGPPN